MYVLGLVGGVGGVVGVRVWLNPGCRGWDCVMSVCVGSLDYLWRWQVQVYVYCVQRI